MNSKSIITVSLIVVAGTAGASRADSINGAFVNVGANQIYSLPLLGGGSYYVGALNHAWSGGTGAAARFNGTFGTFCIDEQNVSSATHVFNLVDITSAPITTTGNAGNSGSSYTSVQAHRLDAVARAAQAAGYLDGRGGFVGSNNDAAAAVQLLIWDSVWEPTAGAGWSLTGGTFQVNVSAAVSNIFSTLAASATGLFNVNGPLIVRSLSSSEGQDQLVLIPLPAAAYAGIGGLAAAFGVTRVHRRNLSKM
jgi:hypothetical protein